MRTSVSQYAAIALLCGLSLAFRPGVSGAQRAEGVVRDVSGPVMSDVYVALLDPSQRTVAAVYTEEDGSFTVRAPASGSYYLRVARIGYRTLFDGPYRIIAGDPLEASVVLHPMAVEMDSLRVNVEGEVRRLAEVGYYERKAAGFGHFIEREEILRGSYSSVGDVLQRVPRVRVVGSLEVGGLNPGVLMNGGASGVCRPTVYLDGAVAAHGGTARRRPVRPDDWVEATDVEAMEVYTGPSTVPVRFQALASCGVMLIWTHHTPLRR